MSDQKNLFFTKSRDSCGNNLIWTHTQKKNTNYKIEIITYKKSLKKIEDAL